MFNWAESKAQGWRAIVVMKDGTESLVVVGMSSSQIRANYVNALEEMFEDDRAGQKQIETIRLEQWYGAPDAGRWTEKNVLRNPFVPKDTAKEKLSKAA
jgi:hypothetical protein